ncbi:MAG TPA: asparaginase domain-containing protein, partial [Candidatus Sulfopaludibacter sp.]|nr:asparaginase domain-containing protein [Candidatus Sulfopaludibacter sp.]
MHAIRILITGGTFDKEYNELTGELFFQQTHLPDMLRLGRCRLEVSVETLMMIDSLQMTDGDRQKILDRCAAVAEDRIVITHGTDTMEATARVLGERLGGKTIVLTGA